MNVLPRLLYLFQTVPAILSKSFFSGITSLLSRFVWANKRPRIAHNVLIRHKLKGGLALPDCRLYYIAAILTRALDCFHYKHSKVWVSLETHIADLNPATLLWLPKGITSALSASLPPVARSIAALNKPTSVAPLLFLSNGPLTPLFGNPSFPPACTAPHFLGVSRRSGLTMRDLSNASGLLPLVDLSRREAVSALGGRRNWATLCPLRCGIKYSHCVIKPPFRVLAKMYPSVSDLCWRCEAEKGTMTHIWWGCPVLQPFWSEVFRLINQITNSSLSNTVPHALLSAIPGSLRVISRSLTCFLLIAARTVVPRRWKDSSPPTIAEWFQEVNQMQRMEDLLSDSLRYSERYARCWAPWLAFKDTDEYKRIHPVAPDSPTSSPPQSPPSSRAHSPVRSASSFSSCSTSPIIP